MFDIIIIAVGVSKNRSLHVPSHCMTSIVTVFKGGGGGNACMVHTVCTCA